MLSMLEVSDYVNVKHATLELPQTGFCALTGETGVGKSLLVGAIALCLGARLERDIVRHGGKKAEVSAAFDISGHPGVLAFTNKAGIDCDDGMLIARRSVDTSRKSRAYINGKLSTLTQLGETIGQLAVLLGQHEHLRLKKSGHRRQLLDCAAGATDLAYKTNVAYEDWHRAKKALEEAKKKAGEIESRASEIKEAVSEIDLIGLTAASWKENNELLTMQSNAVEINELYKRLREGLDSAEGTLFSLASDSERLAELLPSSVEIAKQLSEMSGLVSDLARDMSRISESVVEVDKETLAQAEGFVSEAHRLSRKHKVLGPIQLMEHAEKLRGMLEKLGGFDVDVAKAKESRAMAKLVDQAKALTKARMGEAKKLSAKVQESLRMLGMKQARFEVALEKLGEISRQGAEEVSFRLASRKTGRLSDLGEVASGGELSRASLALFTHVSDDNKDMIFDEVDAGVGGKVAAYVGSQLSALGEKRLVLCVTHLPQVAAAASHHWIVSTDKEGLAELKLVEGKDREEEVARMLAGRKITEASRNNAREILATASA